MKCYYILYKDTIIRRDRAHNCDAWSFKTKEEAEAFIFDHRSDVIDSGKHSSRLEYYIFDSETNL